MLSGPTKTDLTSIANYRSRRASRDCLDLDRHRRDYARIRIRADRDQIWAREVWIQERLGERKYRQLKMHLSGALRPLGESWHVHVGAGCSTRCRLRDRLSAYPDFHGNRPQQPTSR